MEEKTDVDETFRHNSVSGSRNSQEPANLENGQTKHLGNTSTEFKVGNLVGVVNNECQRQMYFTNNNIVRVVESEVKNVTYVYNNLEPGPSQSANHDLLLHIDDIKQSFETLYSSEMAWLKPLPWVTDLEFEPEEFYVDLQLEKMSRGGKLTKEESIKVEDILKPDKGYTNSPKRVLIRGEAGLGKTTMCLKIAYDWSTGKEGNLAESFKLLMMFRLRDLLRDESPEKGFLQFCHLNASKPVDESHTVDALRTVADKILIVLDGYDELNPRHTDSLHNILQSRKDGLQSVFRNSTIVVTSRVTEDEQFLKLFQRHVRIVGLSEESKVQLVKNMFQDDEDRAIAILSIIKKYSDSFKRAATPFILLLMCYLFQNGDRVGYSFTRSEMLRDVLLLMGQKCCERLGIEMTTEEIERLYRRLGEFYFSRDTYSFELLYSRSNIKELYQNEVERNFILECGILRANTFLNKYFVGRDAVEPVHKIFMDFVCVFYMQHCFDSISGIDGKLSFVLKTLKTDRFSLSSFYSRVTFYTQLSIFNGIEFVCIWNKDVEDPETQIAKGTFIGNDDEQYTDIVNDIESRKKSYGEIQMIFQRAEESSTYRGLERFFPQFVKGRDFLVSLLNNSDIVDCVLIFLSDSDYEKERAEGNHNLVVRAKDSEYFLWNCEMCVEKIQFDPDQWLSETAEDSISIIATCHVRNGELLRMAPFKSCIKNKRKNPLQIESAAAGGDERANNPQI